VHHLLKGLEMRAQPDDKGTWITRSIGQITGWLGSFPAIVIAVILVLLWFIGGLFVPGHFRNNTYQLLINTGTTIITFLMVFIIQNTQNRDGRAVQAKLDAQSEVLRAIAERLGIADDEDMLTRLVGVEDAPARVIAADQEKVRLTLAPHAAHSQHQRGRAQEFVCPWRK
jgi:low affinity Fe/Cu permease